MKKEECGFFNSRDGKVNVILLFSAVLVFVLSIFFVEAMTVRLFSPGNFTFNTTTSRNINFTFEANWSFGGAEPNFHENVSNCSLYVIGNTILTTWDIVKNVSRDSMGEDNLLRNGSAGFSYMNFTFTQDNNYTFSVACLNFTNSSGATGRTFSSNFTFTLDITPPVVNTTFNTTLVNIAHMNQVINFTGNITDNIGLLSANITYNISGVITYANYTISGTTAQISNVTTLSGPAGSVINFTLYVTDTSNNVKQNSTLLTIDNTMPIVNTTFNTTLANIAQMNDVINFTGNITENLGLLFVNITNNMSGVITYANYTFAGGTTSAKISNVTTLTGNAGSVINFTMYVTDTSNNVKQNSTLLTIDDTMPIVNTTFNITSPNVNDIINFTGNVTDNLGLLSANITYNMSGVLTKVNFSFAGGTTSAQVSNATKITTNAGSVINFTLYVTDTSNNVKQNSTLITVIDNIPSVVNTTFNTTLVNIAHMNQVINFTGNVTDEGVLLSANITYNISGVITYANYTISGTTAQISNVTTLSGPAGSVINFTLYVTDTGNNVKQNSTLLTIDDTMPIVNTTFNTTLVNIAKMNDVINYTGNVTDNLGLLSANITYNISGVLTKVNFTFAGGTTSAQVSNATTLSGPAGSVINFTLYVTDTSNNVKQNSTLLTIDDTIPVVNTTFNISTTSIRINDIINFTGNVTDNLGLLSANITYNISGVLTKVNFSFAGGTTSAQVSNVTRITTGVGSVINFTMYVTDTANSVKQNSTVFTVADNTTPTLSVTLDLGSAQIGNRAVNGTNTTDTTPTIVWNITESIYDSADWSYIAIDVDGTGPAAGDTCGLHKNYSTAALADAFSNSSITVKDTSTPTCNPLSNGTHTIRFTTLDASGNSNLYIHSFTIETGTPTIILSSLENGLSAVNQSNVTPRTGINFTAVNGGADVLKVFSWTSSCNTSTQTISNSSSTFPNANLTFIYPFQNISSCANRESNQTVTVTVEDSAGNSQTKLYQFLVDDLGPSISVNAPTNGFSGSNNLTVNLSAVDGTQKISAFGYFIDEGIASGVFISLNLSSAIGSSATNTTNVFSVNFTPGTHTIKFTARDALGTVVNNTGNSSVITFTKVGPLPAANTISNSSSDYLGKINYVPINTTLRLKDSTGSYTDLKSNVTNSNETFEMFLYTNWTSANNQINITLTEINGSGVNWDKINFSVLINNSGDMANIQNNWTNTIIHYVSFNNSIDEFTNNNNNYYGTVLLPMNVSGGLEIWWISNESNLGSRTNISQCTSAFTATTTTPCFNFTSGGKTLVQVPHFSIVLASNDSSAPTVNVTTPIGNQTVGMFEANITVSADAVSCASSVNGTVGKVGMAKSGNICITQTERFKNLMAVDGGYNFTFNVTDSSGNINTYIWKFNVSDTTSPNNGEVTSSGTTTGATITITGTNESVNVTVNYGTSNATLGTFASETDFNVTQTVTISGIATVSTAATYYYNITVCDFNGNCKTNGTFTFTQTATAAAAAAAAAAAGGGGGAAAPSNVEASAARQWDSLVAGSSGVLTVNNEKIAVTGVIIDVKNAVTNPSITVESLTSNPLSTAAAAKVYQYLQLTRSNIADVDTSKITINFKVPKSWLTTNNIGEDDVVLYRYSEGKWNSLQTSKSGSDANNVLYSATTPGFSTFAIGGKEAAPAVAPPEEKPAEVPVPTGEVPAVPEEKPAVPAPPEVKKPVLSRTAIAWIVVAIIVIVAAIGYFMWQKKKAE